MPEPSDNYTERARRHAEREERDWYARVIRLSLYGSGALLIVSSIVFASMLGDFGFFVFAAGILGLIAGRLVSL